MPLLHYSAATDVGLKRTNNEDTILSNPQKGLWLVADGMGGHAAGEVASAIVAETVEKQVSAGQSVQEAIRRAHTAVIEAAKEGIGGIGMGSTVVALHSQGTHYEVAWVGDSRAYLWRPHPTAADRELSDAHSKPAPNQHNGELIQLTTDHSYVQMLFDSGAISADEMQHHPEKNIITQCLGSIDTNAVTVDVRQMQWSPGDWVLLCSDGLSDAVTDGQIQQILQNETDMKAAIQALIDKALEQGGKDNISVSLVGYPDDQSRAEGLYASGREWAAKWRGDIVRNTQELGNLARLQLQKLKACSRCGLQKLEPYRQKILVTSRDWRQRIAALFRRRR